MYSRMWHKFFKDNGWVPTEEPYKKLVNQGMIQGVIEYLYLNKEKKEGYSHFLCSKMAIAEGEDNFARIPINIDFVQNYGSSDSYIDKESIEKFIEWRPEFAEAIFECGKGTYHKGSFTPKAGGEEMTNTHLLTQSETGKMSKRYYNAVNPDDVVAQYGTDCFRMYEMFLGPIEQSKPWDTQGISGVSKFLKKFWNLFYKDDKWIVVDEAPTPDELKILHTAIKKVHDDIERLSLNTCISAFMVATNELGKIKCHKKAILEPLTVLLAPFAPYISEELWQQLGERGGQSVHRDAEYPVYNEEYLKEDAFEYPVMIKGKMRAKIQLSLDLEQAEVEKIVLADEKVQQWVNGGTVKRFIYVKGKIVNIVL